MRTPLPAIDDAEGSRVPPGCPPVIDAHVHLFPDPLWEAIWGWFDEHAWPVRYRLRNEQIVHFMAARGVEHLVALHYAHRPGMARRLNAQLASFCAGQPQVTGLATVFPGEDDAAGILAEGFAAGLAGVKLHLHVQGVDPLDDGMQPVYRTCVEHDRPLLMHAGREPRSPAYPRDPHEICSANRIARVLSEYPGLRLCVPHLGADEFDAYADLLLRHDTLWLDTAMMLAGYFPGPVRWDLLRLRPDRILYGSDFPNIPYAWDRELRFLLSAGLDAQDLSAILSLNARSLYGLT